MKKILRENALFDQLGGRFNPELCKIETETAILPLFYVYSHSRDYF